MAKRAYGQFCGLAHALELDAGEGPIDDADLVIVTGPVLRDLMAGSVTPVQAIGDGLVELCGDLKLLTRFTELFELPPPP